MADETPHNVRFSNLDDRLKMSQSRPIRRHTPFTKTPSRLRATPGTVRSAQVASAQPQSKDAVSPFTPFTNADKTFKDFTNKTWRVYSASPLYYFSYDAPAIRNYGSELSKFLSSESKVATRNGTSYKAVFGVVPNVGLTEDDADCVRIIITSSTSKNIVLIMNFLSVGREVENGFMNGDLVVLPVCLAKGPVGIFRQVSLWLSRKFGTKITTATFSPSDLSQLAAIWGTTGKESLELNYDLPETITGLKTIKYTINGKDAKCIWDNMTVAADLTDDKESLFIRALEEHFYHHFKINLSSLQLVTIATGVAFVGCEGRVKMVNPAFVQHVLLQVMHFCK